MDESGNGTISLNEYENYVAAQTKLHPHLGTALNETYDGWNNGSGRVVPYPTDCGTGIPCNFKVYASARHDESSIGANSKDAANGKGGFYFEALWKGYQQTSDLSTAHKPLEKGYGDPKVNEFFGETPHAVQSNTGKPWDASIKIDHAVIFYDPREQDFINEANNAKNALEAKNPKIKIDLIGASSSADYQAGLDAQANFVKTNPGEENVVIINSSHGVSNKAVENAKGLVKYNDKGDLQGQCNGGALTEAMLEAHMQDISPIVNNGFVVIESCGSGAYTDVN
jgi:hypothetical protein